MYRITYERCVCLVFLVVLAFLGCSGYRIDNLAMTDLIERRYVEADEPPYDEPHHRVRHHRRWRAVGADMRALTEPKHRQRPHRSSCPQQEQDVARKAYLANTIVLAKAESISSNRREHYLVLFKVVQRIKDSTYPVDERVRLKFTNERTTCNDGHDAEFLLADRLQQPSSNILVRAKIEQSKEYLLFLRTYGAHNYSIVGTPELSRKRKVPNTVYRIINPAFKPKPAKVEKFERVQNAAESRKRLKLVCKVRGFPIPYIIWKRNGTMLHSNSHVRITYKNEGKERRKSTLVIKNPRISDGGEYECIAHGVDGSKATKELRIEYEKRSHNPTNTRPSTNILSEKPPSGEPCEGNMKNVYCQNGGTCFYESTMAEYGCVCADNYSGPRCEHKTSNQSSMYGQNPRYTCNVGLYTKYDNCS